MKKLNSLAAKKIISNIKKDGYYILKDFLNNNKCNLIKKKLKILYQKQKNNKKHIDERSDSGQLIIRDVVLKNPDNFLPLIDKKLIMEVLENLFRDKFILDNCMGSNSINVKNKHMSLVHIDSHLPTKNPEHTTDIVVMYCFDDFKKNNGTTKIWPKSHLSGIRIQNDKDYKKKINKRFKYVEAKKGSIIFFLGQTWHQIGKNSNNEDRWGLLCHYKKWWIKPSTDFTKCGKRVFNKLNSKQKELFGFTSISPSYDFKNKIRSLKTLRNVKNLDQKYSRVISY